MTCERCYQSTDVGPHGHGLCPLEPRKGHTVVPDDVPGGFVVENGFSTPQRFYSKSAHRAALDREGFQLAPRYVEGNKVGMTKWVSVDLEGATALVSRGAAPRHRGDVGPGGQPLLPPTSALPNEITVSEAGWSVGVRAE